MLLGGWDYALNIFMIPMPISESGPLYVFHKYLLNEGVNNFSICLSVGTWNMGLEGLSLSCLVDSVILYGSYMSTCGTSPVSLLLEGSISVLFRTMPGIVLNRFLVNLYGWWS